VAILIALSETIIPVPLAAKPASFSNNSGWFSGVIVIQDFPKSSLLVVVYYYY